MRLIVILLLLFTTLASAKTLKVAVIDTGLDINDPRLNAHVCNSGHKDFTYTGLNDTNGHGTGIVSLIEKYAGNSDYCLLIYKYYSETASGETNLENEVLALKEAINNGASIVNFSSGGTTYSENEYLIMKYHPEVTFIVAAGNDGKNLDEKCYYYPACYQLNNMRINASCISKYHLSSFSNYGSMVTDCNDGKNQPVLLPGGGEGLASGTSEATAITTGLLIKERLNAK